METNLYSTLRWRRARDRALARDARLCTVRRFLGALVGPCSDGPRHVHHIVAVADGGPEYDLDNLATVCAHHHPSWEALRRTMRAKLLGETPRPRCPHRHVTREAREICERRMARQVAERQLVA